MMMMYNSKPPSKPTKVDTTLDFFFIHSQLFVSMRKFISPLAILQLCGVPNPLPFEPQPLFWYPPTELLLLAGIAIKQSSNSTVFCIHRSHVVVVVVIVIVIISTTTTRPLGGL
jgi:hypothetical protein